MRHLCLCALAAALPARAASAASWPCWRGPNGTGASDETDWSTRWSETAPRLLWRTEVGAGHGAPSVADGRVALCGAARISGEDAEAVACLNAATGDMLWRHVFASTLPSSRVSPSSSPALHAGRVYALGNGAVLLCLDLRTGEPLWQHDLAAERRAVAVPYGYCASPLVADGKVIVPGFTAGNRAGQSPRTGGNYPLTDGRLYAFDARSGAVAWVNRDGASAWSSPVLCETGGRRCIVHATGTAVLAVALDDGATVWRYDAAAAGLAGAGRAGAHASTPLVAADRIVFMGKSPTGGGYDGITACLRLGAQPELVWSSRALDHWFQSPALWHDQVVALDLVGNVHGASPLDGATCWRLNGQRLKSFVIAGNHLIGCRADGGLVLVALDAGGASVAGTVAPAGSLAAAGPASAGGGRRAPARDRWNGSVHPVFADGRLYVRDSAGPLACYDCSASPAALSFR